MKLLLGIAAFTLGQIFGWYQLNLQNISDWWKDKPFLSAIAFGIPTSMFFWYGWKFIYEHSSAAWSARFIGSCTGYFVFAILTWQVLGETMFTPKTLICLTLATIILIIQVFY